jgi:cephalosporin hydroxylase
MVSEFSVADPAFRDRLVRGFTNGSEGWLWTYRNFALYLDFPPPLDAPTFLELDFATPKELIATVPSVTITTRVNGRIIGSPTFRGEGRQHLRLEVPAGARTENPALVEFELNQTANDPASGREVGVIVVGISFKHPESTIVRGEDTTELARAGYLQLLKQRQQKLPVEKQNEMMKLFHDIPIWRHMQFEGVTIEKNPLDLWMMQQIIYETRPEFIVETGTFRGGSALYWAYTLNAMGLENSRVFTVDIQDQTANAQTRPLWKKYVTFRKASSTDAAIVSEIAAAVKGHRTIVTLDSDHTMKHVLNELHAYAPMVDKGSYLIVEDTHMDGVPTQPSFGPGPMAAVLQFLKEDAGREFEQDLSREALIMTFNPGGWLRRK